MKGLFSLHRHRSPPAPRLVSSTLQTHHPGNRKLKSLRSLQRQKWLLPLHLHRFHYPRRKWGGHKSSSPPEVPDDTIPPFNLSRSVAAPAPMTSERRLRLPRAFTCRHSQAGKSHHMTPLFIFALPPPSPHPHPRSIDSLLLLNKNHLSSPPRFTKNNLLKTRLRI